MRIGYARVSSEDQNLARQLAALKEAKVEKIFQEKVSGKDTEHRPELKRALEYARQGDTFVVISLDRLSRDYDDAGKIIAGLQQKHVGLEVLDAPFLSIKTGDADLDKFISEILTKLMAYIAQSERKRIKLRQQEGIILAKERGTYKGGVVQYSADSPNKQRRFIYNQVVRLLDEKRPIALIARTVGLTRATVYRIKDRVEAERAHAKGKPSSESLDG